MAAPESDNVAWYQQKYEEAKNFRAYAEPDWFLNLSFYQGNQWVKWTKTRLTDVKLEDWRVKLVDNRIMPTVVARVAKKTSNRPTFVCEPATGDEAAIDNTEVGEKILTHDWDALSLNDKHLLAEFWSEITGAGFWKIYWDSTAGDNEDFVYAEDGKALTGTGGGPMKASDPNYQEAMSILKQNGVDTSGFNVKKLAQGDIAVDVITPFELYPDPHATSLNDCEWIIEEKIRSKNYVERFYGVKDVQEDVNVPVGITQSRSMSQSNSDQAKGVRVFEYFCRANNDFPNGRWAVWFNDKVVREVDGPASPYAGFPYVMFSSNLVPGRFWPQAVTTHLRSPQTNLNKIESQIMENAQRIGNPTMFVSKGSGIQPKGKVGGIAYYNDIVQNPIPQYLAPPELPEYLREQIGQIENSFNEISGVHDISQGKVPAGVTAASAINLLLEADDTRLGPEIQLMEHTLGLAGQYILELRAKWTPDARTVRLAGEDGMWDIFQFKKDMLEKVVNVRVEAGSGMPHSKAAKQAAMQEVLNMALQYGIPLNPKAMRSFFRDFEMGGLDKLFADLEEDESQIMRENRRMYNGESFPINEQDNNDMHIEGHYREMKTSKYEKSDNDIKGRFVAHVKEHMARKMGAVDAQIEAQQKEAGGAAQAQSQQKLEEIALKNKPKEQQTALEATEEPEGETGGEKENSESKETSSESGEGGEQRG